MIPFDPPDSAEDFYRGLAQKYISYDRLIYGINLVNLDIAGKVSEILDAYRNGKDPNDLLPSSETEFTPYPLETIRDNPNANEIDEILENTSVNEQVRINLTLDLGDGWTMELPMAIGQIGESWQAYFTGVYFTH